MGYQEFLKAVLNYPRWPLVNLLPHDVLTAQGVGEAVSRCDDDFCREMFANVWVGNSCDATRGIDAARAYLSWSQASAQRLSRLAEGLPEDAVFSGTGASTRFTGQTVDLATAVALRDPASGRAVNVRRLGTAQGDYLVEASGKALHELSFFETGGNRIPPGLNRANLAKVIGVSETLRDAAATAICKRSRFACPPARALERIVARIEQGWSGKLTVADIFFEYLQGVGSKLGESQGFAVLALSIGALSTYAIVHGTSSSSTKSELG